MRRLLWISGLALLGSLGLFAILMAVLTPVWLAPVEGDGWTADLPRFGTHEAWERNGWQARRVAFATSVMVAVRPMDGPPSDAVADAAQDAIGKRTVEDVAIPAIEGRFVLSGRGRSWTATLLFPADGRLFWVASEARGSNVAESMTVVSRVAASLRLNGAAEPALGRDARRALDVVVVPAVERHLFPMRHGLPLMVLLLALGLGFGTALAAWGGRLPKRAPDSPPVRLAAARVWIVLHRPWRYKSTLGAVVLDDDGLSVFVMARRVAHVPAGELYTVRREIGRAGNATYAIERDGLLVRFTPNDPAPWAAALGR